ncbi:MAG: hypothetical protein ACFFD4_12550 [Candidatus Odinarchaeota archaeon]
MISRHLLVVVFLAHSVFLATLVLVVCFFPIRVTDSVAVVIDY